MVAERLFKYLPEQYVSNVLNGFILFRNLVYFKRIEHDPRVDVYEGLHSSETDSDYTIYSYKRGRLGFQKMLAGRWPIQYVLTNPDRIFCFCVSARLHVQLTKFGGSCIEIYEPQEFRRRMERRLTQIADLHRLEQPVLLSGHVIYYNTKRSIPAGVDRNNPMHLPFLKREEYASEAEVRFVFARKNGYKIQSRFISRDFDYTEDLRNKLDKQIVIELGSIRDIARRVNF